ncbi:S41 family peptidase [Hominifimenecus sp. rT4P-3]|uniref:S41 family peptidase n=1 Tax=Hominifimenecus sp. rT4P-3 TaxID=3242979 RepID=UPI003DA57C23
MNKKNRNFQNGLLVGISATVVVMAVVFLAGAFFLIPKLSESRNAESLPAPETSAALTLEQKLQEIDAYIDGTYIFDVDKEQMINGLLAGYVDGLGDPYSVYYTEQELEEVLQSANGTYYGIGILAGQMQEGQIKIVNVFSNSPAQEVGMQKDDWIVGVNGTSTDGMDLSQVVAQIKGAEGSDVTVQIYRERTRETLDFVVERREVSVDTVEYRMLEDGIGYLYLMQFDDVSLEQMKNALADLTSQGMKGLILDLRDNPGGLLTSVVDIADLFLPECNIFYMEDKAGNRVDYDSTAEQYYTGPMTVLVNENSASAAEVLSGTLKDHQRAKLVGTTTFGKGIVQTFYELSDGSGIKLTTAHYFTPNGTDIHGTGIKLDVEVKWIEDGERDVQLEKAQEVLRQEVGQQME